MVKDFSQLTNLGKWQYHCLCWAEMIEGGVRLWRDPVFCFANVVRGSPGNTERKYHNAIWIVSLEFSTEVWANRPVQPQNSS